MKTGNYVQRLGSLVLTALLLAEPGGVMPIPTEIEANSLADAEPPLPGRNHTPFSAGSESSCLCALQKYVHPTALILCKYTLL